MGHAWLLAATQTWSSSWQRAGDAGEHFGNLGKQHLGNLGKEHLGSLGKEHLGNLGKQYLGNLCKQHLDNLGKEHLGKEHLTNCTWSEPNLSAVAID